MTSFVTFTSKIAVFPFYCYCFICENCSFNPQLRYLQFVDLHAFRNGHYSTLVTVSPVLHLEHHLYTYCLLLIDNFKPLFEMWSL